MLYLMVSLAVSGSVCDLLSYDPETCLSVYGCGYCIETGKCYSTYDLDGAEYTGCSYSNALKTKKQKKLGKCFSLYSDDGCQTCVSRDKSVSCGWCQSLGVCAEGSVSGPSAFECGGDDWLFNKTTCDRSMCASAKTKEACRMPCRWSDRGVCLMPSKVKNAAEAQEIKKENIEVGKRVFLGVGICFVAVAIAAIALIVWKSTRPLYKQLPMMNNDFRLDSLPSPAELMATK